MANLGLMQTIMYNGLPTPGVNLQKLTRMFEANHPKLVLKSTNQGICSSKESKWRNFILDSLGKIFTLTQSREKRKFALKTGYIRRIYFNLKFITVLQ